MDGDWSDLLECISWYHMIMVCQTLLRILFSLSRPGTIGQNKVEVIICTIFFVIFKANECMKGTVFLQHLFDHCRTWELKHWSRTTRACRLWKPVISFAVDFLHPLGYFSVKATVDPLQLYPLPAFEAKLGDVHKEFRPSNFTAKFLWSRGLEMYPNIVNDFLLCSSIKTERLGRYVHFYS